MHITYSYEIIDHPIITLVTKNKSNFCKTWKMQYVSFYKRLYILCLFDTDSQTLNKNETFTQHNPPHYVTFYVIFFYFCFFYKKLWQNLRTLPACLMTTYLVGCNVYFLPSIFISSKTEHISTTVGIIQWLIHDKLCVVTIQINVWGA